MQKRKLRLGADVARRVARLTLRSPLRCLPEVPRS
jgi:hypothetical protein